MAGLGRLPPVENSLQFSPYIVRLDGQYFPQNPNGPPEGITALTITDGRVTIMTPRPERVTRTVQHSCPLMIGAKMERG